MKTSTKIAVITAVICIVIGIALLSAFGIKLLIAFDRDELKTQKYEDSTYQLEETAFEINNIIVDVVDADVAIYTTTYNDGRITITCSESENIKHSFRIQNGTLTVKRTDTRPWYERFSFRSDDDNIKVEIAIPQRTLDSLSINTVSGDVVVADDFRFEKKVDISTTSGDIMFESYLVDGELELSSTSGDITATHVDNGSVKASATSGDIRLFNINTALLNLSTTSGSIDLILVVAAGAAEIETTSGDINLAGSDAGTYNISSTSGDVTGRILSPKNFKTSSVSGEISHPPAKSSAGECSITTISGNITIQVDP